MARATINVGVNTAAANNRINQLGANANAANNRMAAGTSRVTDLYDRLSASAQQLIRDMVQANSTRGPEEMVSAIERQIRAQERFNRMRREADLIEARQDLDAGSIDQDQYSERVRNIRSGSQESSLESQLLREMIEAIRESAREGVSNDRRGVERSLANTRLDEVREGENEEEVLRRAYQRGMLGDPPEPESTGGGQNNRGGELVNTTLGVVSNENELYAMASIAGMIPVIGAGLSSFMTKAFKDAEEFEVARGKVRGRGDASFNPDQRGLKYGLSQTDFMSQFVDPTISARGKNAGAEDEAMKALMLNRGAGVDENTIMSLIKNSRTASVQDPLQVASSLQGTLERVGAVAAGDFSRIGEYLEINNSLLGDQLVRLDAIDSNTNLKLIGGLSAMGGSFADPRVAGKIANQMDQSLRNPSNPFIEAIQYEELSRLDPNMNYFEFMERRSRGIQDEEGSTAMVDRVIRDAGGNESLAMMNVSNVLGMQGQESMVRRLVENRMAGLPLFTQLEDSSDLSKEGLESRSGAVTGRIRRLTAANTDEFAQGGIRLAGSLSEAIGGLGGMPALVEKIFDVTVGGVSMVGKVVSGVERIVDFIDSQSSDKGGSTTSQFLNPSGFGQAVAGWLGSWVAKGAVKPK